MVELSRGDRVLREPNLNLEMLQLEEKLLAVRLLSISDIKNVEEMKDPASEVRRVEEILLSYLNVEHLNSIFMGIDKSGIEVDHRKKPAVPDAQRISVLLALLSEMANLDRFVYHAHDGRSLASLKWEKTLTDYHSGNYLPSFEVQEELNVSRIFRRLFKETIQFVGKHQEKLNSIFRPVSYTHLTLPTIYSV